MSNDTRFTRTASEASDGRAVIDGFIRDSVRRKARQLVGKAGFTRSDRKDIEQELYLKLLKAARSFDPAQAHWRSFATAVIERHVASLLRDKQAEKRDSRRVCSLELVIGADKGRPIQPGETIGRREYDARRGCQPREEQDLCELTQDVAEVIAGLPAGLRELAESLKTESISEIARRTGVPRTTLNGRVRRLRERLAQAGLKNYL